ncbi:probable serine/threonine-protein kinase DDB_G0272282 isoform X2 [Panonychus citri]|uniref:probable serine/threonine-protein kinase DDB_G0272282 isoform X2 n=1 Tax=Panonychus citri TaxID=50023 RepID=UPI00230786A3|nr:probable serine/threonine-protein kinase DDB_G0272282 isoform X2 [Panonychus citri]
MVIQFVNMSSSSGTATVINCSNVNCNNNDHYSDQIGGGSNLGGDDCVGVGVDCGDKPSLSLSLSNNSSSSSSSSSSVTGCIGVSGYNFNRPIVGLSKFHQQDAATSPTIPLLSTLIYDCNSSTFYSTNNSGDEINNNNSITPTSTLTSIGCSSPIINRTSPQFNNNGSDLNNNNIINNFNNNIITNKNTNNQRLTNNGNGTIKTLLIKSNCRPSDLVCSLKSPSTCLACYTNCSTCNNNNNGVKSTINTVNYDYNSNSSFDRLVGNHNSSIKRSNIGRSGLNGLNGINGNTYLPESMSGLNYYGPISNCSSNLTTTITTFSTANTTTTTIVGGVKSTINVTDLAFSQSHIPKTTTTMINGGGITSSRGGGCGPGGGITIPSIQISPTGYDDHHLSSSPTNSRTYDKFDNFNSNIFNDHCSAISAPLSSYYLDEPKNHSCFRKSIPTMPIALSAFLLLLNCFLPGSVHFV